MNKLLTVEDTVLDEMVSHEAGCEANHANPDNITCSGPVTHRYRTVCGLDKLVCANSAARTQRLIALPRHTCMECSARIADCWTVTPA